MTNLTIHQVKKGDIVYHPLLGKGKVDKVDLKAGEALIEFEVKTEYKGTIAELLPNEIWIDQGTTDPFDMYSFRYLFPQQVYVCEVTWRDYITEEGDSDSQLVFEPINQQHDI